MPPLFDIANLHACSEVADSIWHLTRAVATRAGGLRASDTTGKVVWGLLGRYGPHGLVMRGHPGMIQVEQALPGVQLPVRVILLRRRNHSGIEALNRDLHGVDELVVTPIPTNRIIGVTLLVNLR